MELIRRGLKKIDIGGVPPNHTVHGTESSYKSANGGLLSLLIILLSVSYTFYILFTWYAGQILPKTQVSQIQIDYEEFSFDQNPMSFTFQTSKQNPVNPFQDNQIILIPLVQQISEDQQSSPNHIAVKQSHQNKQTLNFNQYQSNNLTLVFNQNENIQNTYRKNDTQILVTFVQCSPKLLSANQSCANQSTQDNYFSSPGKKISMNINFQVFDQDIKELQPRSKSYSFLLDKSQSLFTQVVFQIQNMTIEHGLLFQSKKHLNFLSSVKLQTQTISFNESLLMFGSYSYASFLMSLDSLKQSEEVVYPTLGEVGASISCIVHLIFLMRYLITRYNKNQFRTELIEVIIQSSQQNQNNNKKNEKTQKTLDIEAAIAKTNIFNLHNELSKMRIQLDEIIAKKQCDEYQNISITDSIPDQSQALRIKDHIEPWLIFDNSGQGVSIKKPDKLQQIELQPQYSDNNEQIKNSASRKSSKIQYKVQDQKNVTSQYDIYK